MAIKRPDIYEHNNPNLPIVDSDFIKGGFRTAVQNLSDLYALSNKVDQLKPYSTQVYVSGENKLYLLKDINNINNGNGWQAQETNLLNLVYTTGDQIIRGEKELASPTSFTNLLEVTTDKLIFNKFYTGMASGDFNNYAYLGGETALNGDGTILGITVNNNITEKDNQGNTLIGSGFLSKCYIYTRQNTTDNWEFKETIATHHPYTGNGSIYYGTRDLAFNEDGSVLCFSSNKIVQIFTGSKLFGWKDNLIQTISGNTNDPFFGDSVTFNKDFTAIAISSLNDSTVGTSAGRIYIYTGSVNNKWKLKTSLYPEGGDLTNAYYGKPLFNDDGSILFVCRGSDISLNYVDIFTGSVNNGWGRKQVISLGGYPVGYYPTDTYLGANTSCSPDGSTFIFTKNRKVNNIYYSSVEIWTGNKNDGWQSKNFLLSPAAYTHNRNTTTVKLSRDGEYIIHGQAEIGGLAGGIHLYRKTSTDGFRLSQTIYANTAFLNYVPEVTSNKITLAKGRLGSFIGTDNNFNNVVLGAGSAKILNSRPGCIGDGCVDALGYAASFNLAQQSIQINSQETDAPMVNINGSVSINSPFRPTYNNTGILLAGEVIAPDSNAQLLSLTFKNGSSASYPGPSFKSKFKGIEIPTSIVIRSDEVGDIVDFTETGVNFAIRPAINGDGVVLQSEAYTNNNPSGFITGVNLTSYITKTVDLNNITENFTFQSGWNSKLLKINSTTSVTGSVPTGLPIGYNIAFAQIGIGSVTIITGHNSVNIYQRNNFTKTAGQYAIASLVSHDTNKYLLYGDLS